MHMVTTSHSKPSSDLTRVRALHRSACAKAMGMTMARAVFAACFLMACLLAAGDARAQVVPQAIHLKTNGKPVDITIDVKASGAGRIVFSTLRSTVPLARIDVLAPSGRTVWSGSGQALELLPAAEAKHPELGAVYRIEAVRFASAGLWKVRLVPASAEAGTIVGAYTVRPRFELLLPLSPLPLAAGERTVLEVLPTDHGEVMSGISGIPVRIEDQAGKTVFRGEARTGLRNARGILLSQDNLVYLAVATLPAPGRYRLVASHDFGQGDVISVREIVVK